jgi:hypothetical protein
VSLTYVHSYRLSTGKCYIALLAKRSYRIRPGAPAEPLREHEAFVLNPEYEDSKNAGAGHRLVRDSDRFCAEKTLTDVLVRGSAHAPSGPVGELVAAVEVGAAKKRIRVVGDRSIELTAGGGVAFTKPARFERMPLTWDVAFGGRDAYGEAKLSETPSKLGRTRHGLAAGMAGLLNPKEAGWSLSYPRNISGRGFFLDIDRDRIQGAALPNLEDPGDPLVPDRLLLPEPFAWIDLPVAACFEPIDTLTFPRCVYMLPPASSPPLRPIYEIATGVIQKADFEDTRLVKIPPNPRLYNCAPAGLAVCRLEGDERVKLANLHPKHASLEFDLPGERPQLLLEPPGCPAAELTPLLQTVSIEPDEERVTLTWAGTLEVAAPFPKEITSEMRHAAVFKR